MKFDSKKILPYVIAIALFAAISSIFFSPIFDDKVIAQGDVRNFKGISKEITDYRQNHTNEPLWTNSAFGGMPAYQISILYKSNFLQYIDSALKLWLPHPIGIVFLYFFGFFILLRCLKVNPWLAIAGAVLYGFSSYYFIILEAGHNTKALALAYMAPLLGSILLTLRGKIWLGGGLTALFTGLELYANHLQITYYLFMLVAIIVFCQATYVIVKHFVPSIDTDANEDKVTIGSFTKSLVVLAFAAIIGVLPNITNLWATYEYGKYSTRGKSDLTIAANTKDDSKNKTSGLDKDYATQWSYGVDETFTLLIPNFKGGGSGAIGSPANEKALDDDRITQRDQVAGSNAYFGTQPFTSGPVYIGAIAIFLCIVGLFVLKGPLKYGLVIGTVLTIALSWGKNYMGLTNFFMDHVPGYNKFRAVSMILVVAELTIPLLAILAIDKLIKSKDSLSEGFELFIKRIKFKFTLMQVLIISFALTGGFAALAYVAPTMVNTFAADQYRSDGKGGAVLVTEANEEIQQTLNQKKQYEEIVQSGKIAAYPKEQQEQIMGLVEYPEAQLKSVINQKYEQIKIARQNIFKADAGRTFIFILLALVILVLYAKSMINEILLASILGVFFIADMWPIATRYINDESYVQKAADEIPYDMTDGDSKILADTDLDYRVFKLGNPFNDASCSYFHKSIGGYHGAKLKRYAEVIDFYLDREHQLLSSNLNPALPDSMKEFIFKNTPVVNMLNTKYILQNGNAIKNPLAYGNAWFVKDVNFVANADAEITTLGKVNPRYTAVVNQSYKEKIGSFTNNDANATIKLTSYEPNYLIYQTKSNEDKLAVFSEIYYPKGWNAYIDGQLTDYVNADYILRAMKIPKGDHKIEFKFEPSVYNTGETISLIGSILLIIALGGGIYVGLKKSKESEITA